MQPTCFINHGGGPCFLLEPGPVREAWSGLEGHLRRFAGTLPERPNAILVVSGHWEEGRRPSPPARPATARCSGGRRRRARASPGRALGEPISGFRFG